jgi:thiamine biosynthesis lipoprotein
VKRRIGQIIGLAVLAGIAVLLAVAVSRNREPHVFRRNPSAVMGTDCSIQVVFRADQVELAQSALAAAEAELRKVESRMSVKLDSSEISHLNASPAGRVVTLTPASLEVLTAARGALAATGGAFDVTARPLFELWKQAGKAGRLPTAEQLAQARAASAWEQITLRADGAIKSTDTACVDLGGLAKGFAVDQAAQAMIRLGAGGGLVEAGGDIYCFGTRPDGSAWRIAIRDPFCPNAEGEKPFAVLRIESGGVCTSGNYFRFTEIGGRRFSHIIDPRPGPAMGMPAEVVPSVTVVARAAITADIWATALSVLGAEGFRLIPKDSGIEAMVVEGAADGYRIHMTGGFGRLLEESPATQPWAPATTTATPTRPAPPATREAR